MLADAEGTLRVELEARELEITAEVFLRTAHTRDEVVAPAGEVPVVEAIGDEECAHRADVVLAARHGRQPARESRRDARELITHARFAQRAHIAAEIDACANATA